MANEKTINWIIFCKRTNYPKLGYIISRLNAMGIPCQIKGESFHAPILCIPKGAEEIADKILTRKIHGRIVDNIPDDDPQFNLFKNVKPNPL